jgi:hypothetical protein
MLKPSHRHCSSFIFLTDRCKLARSTDHDIMRNHVLQTRCRTALLEHSLNSGVMSFSCAGFQQTPQPSTLPDCMVAGGDHDDHAVLDNIVGEGGEGAGAQSNDSISYYVRVGEDGLSRSLEQPGPLTALRLAINREIGCIVCLRCGGVPLSRAEGFSAAAMYEHCRRHLRNADSLLLTGDRTLSATDYA